MVAVREGFEPSDQFSPRLRITMALREQLLAVKNRILGRAREGASYFAVLD
jgi:hypothetical protein